MSDRITIDQTTGPIAGEGLMKCYFKPKKDDTYNFHDKDEKIQAMDLTVGSIFSFTLDEYPHIEYTLTIVTGSKIEVTGTWKTKDKGAPAEEDGGYQAQAGGGLDVESSASAYA